ncbi:hypothetical protein HZY62_04335 [Maribacter polysiphoniae]|uniref:Uncharacterized protein n=1 Tax=Maribacter polysiphoniae TaxID=429344 RepID=A0A316E0I1_9FLAO|nr:hypothetical protein [Maribacter polysiphoniae]MBD1259805.1 hypothetical protein [Maribacter polysiphoniae]PWK23052.1 hypothetical protein LX92_02381 [Maribacter polysiphoniae]
MTNQKAEYLIKLEKVLADPHQTIDLKNKKNRLELVSHQDSERNFWVEMTSNQKIILKTSIHHLESNTFVGLLRIDFKGTHQNPTGIKDTLPEDLIPYVGKWFEPEDHHMHVFVEGYKPLAWAIPLADTDFPIKEINDASDLSDLITNFARLINLKSLINIQQAIL